MSYATHAMSHLAVIEGLFFFKYLLLWPFCGQRRKKSLPSMYIPPFLQTS